MITTVAVAQRAVRQHRTKALLVGALALTWSFFLLGYFDDSGAENELLLHERRALAEQSDPAAHAPATTDDRTVITVYLVQPLANNPAYPGYSPFVTGMLDRFGSGRFRYDVRDHERCDRYCRTPRTDDGPCIVAAREKDCPHRYRQCNFPQCKVMLTGDEHCDIQTPHDIREYYSAKLSHKAYLPLGARRDAWTALKAIQGQPGFVLKPPSQRAYAFNAIFSQATDSSRRQLASVINYNRSKTGMMIFTNMPRRWSQYVNSPSNTYSNTHEYTTALLDSAFTLSPAGHNPECFRLYEAVEAGSIPVLVERDLTAGRTHGCYDSLRHWRDAPIVRLGSWNELFPTVERLMEDGDALDKMQTDLLAWYEGYMRGAVADFEDFMRGSDARAGGERRQDSPPELPELPPGAGASAQTPGSREHTSYALPELPPVVGVKKKKAKTKKKKHRVWGRKRVSWEMVRKSHPDYA